MIIIIKVRDILYNLFVVPSNSNSKGKSKNGLRKPPAFYPG
jgi:hypothetical protein